MKRFLCAGERYALPGLKNKLYLTFAISRQTNLRVSVIAIFLGLLCLWTQDGLANDSAPVMPTAGAVFSAGHHSYSHSQQQQSITGTVVDKDGQPIEGLTVAVRGGGAATTTSTDADGRFVLTA